MPSAADQVPLSEIPFVDDPEIPVVGSFRRGVNAAAGKPLMVSYGGAGCDAQPLCVCERYCNCGCLVCSFRVTQVARPSVFLSATLLKATSHISLQIKVWPRRDVGGVFRHNGTLAGGG